MTALLSPSPLLPPPVLDDATRREFLASTPDGFSLERVAALEPDLILAIDDPFLTPS